MSDREISRMEAGTIQFQYPANWSREIEETAEGISIVLQSQGATFCIIGVYGNDQEPTHLVDEALDSLRDEHPGLEVEELPEGDWEAEVAVEAVFMSIDTVSYCWLRGGRVSENSVLLYVQTTDNEAEQTEALFRAIGASIEPLPE